MSAVPEAPPLLTRSFALLVCGHFLQALGYSSMLLLPLYLQHLGASRTTIGVAMATASVTGLCARPVVGWALDAFGRKPTLVVGTVFLAAGMGLIALVDRVGPILYAQRAVVGVGIGALFAGYFTAASDVVPVARRTEGLALFGISGQVPLLVNPFADELRIAPADLRWFLPAIGLLILASLVPLFALREPRAVATPTESARLTARDALVALRRRPLWPAWFATAAFSGLVVVFMTFATVTAARRGVARPATLWLPYALGAIGVRVVGGRLPDRIGPANLVAPAMGAYVCGVLLAADAGSLGDFLVAGLVAGVGHGYCFPVLAAQVVTRTPDRYRGSALAMFTAIWGTSELVVAPLFGAVADRGGDAAMFWLAAACGIVALVVWVVLEHRLAGARGATEPAQWQRGT
jgi:MFS family permease